MSEPRARDIKIDGPFLWAEKGVTRRIRDTFDGTTYLDQANAVYMTLCELASDNQSPVFTARKRTISERSGVSLRRTTEILDTFKQAGILAWIQNKIPGTKELAPSSYTLLGLGTACPTSGTASPTLGTACPRSGTDAKRENCRVSEESPEQSPRKSREETHAPECNIPTEQEVIAFGATWPGDMARGIPAGIPKDFCQHYHEQSNIKQRWIVSGGRLINWQADVVSWWRKDWRTWQPTQDATAPARKLTLADFA